MREFRLAPMSPTIWGLTLVVFAIAVGVPTAMAFAPPREFALWFAPAIAVFLAVVLVFVWAWWRPRRFEVSSEGLRIVWPLQQRFIPRGEITAVRRVEKAELGWTIRTWGAGGFLGGFGRFRSRKLGPLEVYVSRSDGMVFVERAGARPLLLTPERPEEFVEEVSVAMNVGR